MDIKVDWSSKGEFVQLITTLGKRTYLLRLEQKNPQRVLKRNLRSTREVLEAVKSGAISISKADQILKLDALSVVDEIARLDVNRYLRRGVPEIVYARGKSLNQLGSIISRLLEEAKKRRPQVYVPIIASKVTEDQVKLLKQISRKYKRTLRFHYFPEANITAFFPRKTGKENIRKMEKQGRVALLSAGTSDIPILNEAQVILELMGSKIIRFNDVGVASLRRLASPLKEIQKFDPDAVIVAAGMEAALPSVIAGLSSVPVIGLPTSVGYGYGRNGEAALMSMLQACPLGISVVNIDGGIAAGIIAWLIARRSAIARGSE